MDISEALAFLGANHRSVLITYRSNGEPAPTPVVHGVGAGDRVLVSSREPAYKVRNLRRNPRAIFCAFTDNFFGKWVTLSGTAEIIPLPDAMPLLESLYREVAGEHPDWDEYRIAMERERRVVIAVTPESAGPDRSA